MCINVTTRDKDGEARLSRLGWWAAGGDLRSTPPSVEYYRARVGGYREPRADNNRRRHRNRTGWHQEPEKKQQASRSTENSTKASSTASGQRSVPSSASKRSTHSAHSRHSSRTSSVPKSRQLSRGRSTTPRSRNCPTSPAGDHIVSNVIIEE